MRKQPGFIDARRAAVGGIAGWTGPEGGIPAILIPGHLDAFGIYEDFLMGTELAARETPMGWESDEFNAGGVFAIADHIGGVALVQTNGGDNDAMQATLGSCNALGSGGAFWPQAGKDIWFEARVKHSYDPADVNLAFGLIHPGVAQILRDNGVGCNINNRLMFVVLDGEDTWYFEGDKAGDTDKNDLEKAPADLAWHTYGFHVRGVTAVDVFYDRVVVAGGKVLTANIPTAAGLMPFFAITAGSAIAEAIYVDYIMCIQKR